MRYGIPSIADALLRLRESGCERVLVLRCTRNIPRAQRFRARCGVRAARAMRADACAACHRTPITTTRGYIGALAQNINDYWVRNGRPTSSCCHFHGVPRRSLDLGDPYHCHCTRPRGCSRRSWAQAEQYAVTFQSRFGRGEWLKPYTQRRWSPWPERACGGSTSPARASSAIASRALEEIALDARAAFLKPEAPNFTPFLPQRAPGVDCSAGGPRIEKPRAAGSICPRLPQRAR